MRITAVFLTLVCSSFVLAGCDKQQQKKEATNIIRPANETAIFTAMGRGLLGTSLDQMSMPDRRMALEAEYKALEYTAAGKPINWSSPRGTASGTVTPGQPYSVGSQNCRQYSHNFVVNGVPQTSRGGACRNENGSWSPLT